MSVNVTEVDTNSSEWKSQRVSVQTQEADDADDGFDLSLLEGVLTSSLEDVEDKHEGTLFLNWGSHWWSSFSSSSKLL